jgi:hypothetical protein
MGLGDPTAEGASPNPRAASFGHLPDLCYNARVRAQGKL